MSTLLLLLLAAAPRWEVPNSVSEIPVPGEMRTQGIPNRMHVVLSSLPVQELHDHFFRAFVDAGLHVPPPHQQLTLDGQYMLTAFDPQTEISYSVILQPYPSGKTLVIQGEAHFGGHVIAPDSHTFAPLFPGAVRPIRASFEGVETLSYSVRAGSDEVLAFYREVLASEGFELGGDGEFVREGEAIQVVMRRKQGDPRTEVVLMRRSVAPERRQNALSGD